MVFVASVSGVSSFFDNRLVIMVCRFLISPFIRFFILNRAFDITFLDSDSEISYVDRMSDRFAEVIAETDGSRKQGKMTFCNEYTKEFL